MNTNNKYILIVEDSPTQAERLREILEESGYKTDVASNGEQALDKLKVYQPLLMISDILMPKMDGYTLCQRMKADEKYKNIPFILLTSLSDPKDIIKGLQCGADNFITKPYDAKYLLTRIRYVLANQELSKEEKIQMGLEVIFEGQKYLISSNRKQILDLLICAYETAIQKNGALLKAEDELRRMNDQLERKVEERTSELQKQIEERKKIEEQLFQFQKMESIGRLAGGVAHDFNNILTAIGGYAEIAQRSAADNPKVLSALHEINVAADRAAALTRQLLAFSRKQLVAPQIVGINSVVSNLDQMLRRIIGEHIELILSLDPSAGNVEVDTHHLEQVIMNLVVNGRDAMPKGGAITIQTANLDVDAEYSRTHIGLKPGAYVLLSVADTGIGMDQATQSKIFEPFFTTKEMGKGTGLGLAMVYGIVKQSGGDVHLYSEVGHGTIFKIYLPRIKGPVSSAIKKEVSVISLKGTETILLAEDEDLVRKFTVHVLTEEGYKVLPARNGAQALALLKDHSGKIDLLLTDTIMPGMSGQDLVKQASASHPAIKVIYMSGYTNMVLSKDDTRKTDFHFVEKPFTPDTLLKKIRSVLDAK